MQAQTRITNESHKWLARTRRPQSLSRRLVLMDVSVLFFVLMIAGGATFVLISYYLMANADHRLQSEGQKLQAVTTLWQSQGHALNLVNQDFLNELLNQTQTSEFDSSPFSLRLIDPQTGAVIKSSANLKAINLPHAQADIQAALHGQQVVKTYQNAHGQTVRVLTLPLHNTAQHIVAVVQVSLSLAGIIQIQVLLALLLLGGSLFATLVTYCFAFILVKRALRPLTLLGRSMDEVATQGLHARVAPQQHTSEVQMLSSAFNHMLQQLEVSFLGQEDFVADVSHELRTPLTAIRGQIDVLLLKPEHSEETRQDLYSVQAEIGRLSRLVANLLTHARAEIGILPQLRSTQRSRVELDGILLEILHQIRFLKPQVAIAFKEFQQCEIVGDRDLLKQLFFNLLDNAVTYTPAGGRIVLDLVRGQETVPASLSDGKVEPIPWVTIAIHNTGAGISQDDLPHIFERHYRADQTAASGKHRSGLGLPIALMIAQAHGGTITVESTLDEGTCFTVWLPLSQVPREERHPSSQEAGIGGAK